MIFHAPTATDDCDAELVRSAEAHEIYAGPSAAKFDVNSEDDASHLLHRLRGCRLPALLRSLIPRVEFHGNKTHLLDKS